jgi:hypothetical protein
VPTGFFFGGGRTEGKINLENLGVEDRTIRKVIVKNCVGGRAWNGLIWLRIWTVGRPLCLR